MKMAYAQSAMLGCALATAFVPMQLRAEDEQAMAELMALLDEETVLATQSKMNADYVPGMVSILHREEMQKLGAGTVADALDKVAGFYTRVNSAGEKVIVVRGLGATLNATNLKLMLNGVAFNRAVDGSADWLLRLPLEMVDRIEVIRGPGSALYGEFAFAGVVNIIPRNDKAVSAKLASHNRYQGSVSYQQQLSENSEVSLNLARWQKDSSKLATNRDNFAWRGLGHSPGFVDNSETGSVLTAHAALQGYKLQLQLVNVDVGGGHGRGAALTEQYAPRSEQVQALSFDKNWQLSDVLSASLALGWRKNEVQLAEFLPIVAGIDPPGDVPVLKTDVFVQDGDKGSQRRANLSVHWQGIENHTVFMDVGYVHNNLDAIYSKRSFAPDDVRFIYNQPDYSRTLTSFTLQDLWHVNDNLELTIGARHDHYDDWGDHTSPRFAAVWRQGDNHIFKFQYADAFRPPTLRELNLDDRTKTVKLREEQLQSTELSYIYREAGKTLRSTLFSTHVEDLIEFYIQPGKSPIYRNLGDITIKGFELEWQQSIARAWDVFANLSYSAARDNNDPDKVLTGSVARLANLGLTWHATAQRSHSLALQFVDNQEGWEVNTREPQQREFGAYSLIDYNYTHKQLLGVPELEAQLSINNLTNKKYNILANPANFPTGLSMGERTVSVALNYHF